jgi:hypothetical protein
VSEEGRLDRDAVAAGWLGVVEAAREEGVVRQLMRSERDFQGIRGR